MADNKTKTAPATAAKADNKTPRERFLSVGANRVGKAIKALRNVKQIANRKTYEYTPAEIEKATRALRAEMEVVEKTFRDAIEGKTTAAGDTGFTFG